MQVVNRPTVARHAYYTKDYTQPNGEMITIIQFVKIETRLKFFLGGPQSKIGEENGDNRGLMCCEMDLFIQTPIPHVERR